MIEFTLPLPTSINASYARNSRSFYKTAKARDWEDEAFKSLREQRLTTNGILGGDIYVGIEMFVKRDRDIDSGLKILLDFMQDKLYINDSQIKHLNVRKYKDKVPRVVVTIEELDI